MRDLYLKARVQEAAYNFGTKLTESIQKRKDNFIIDRIWTAHNKMDQFLPAEKQAEIYKKVEEKGSKLWASSHKIQNFILKNSDKIKKSAFLGVVVTAAAEVVALASKFVSSKESQE